MLKKFMLFAILYSVLFTAPCFAQYGLDFNGTDGHIDFGGPLLPELGLDVFTLECWFYRSGAGVTSSSGSGGVNAAPLITRGRGESDGSTLDCNYFFGVTSSGVLAADFEDMASGANHPVLGSTSIQNSVWYHAAVTYDGSTWRLYLNGGLENEETETATPRHDSIQHFCIASAMNSTGVREGAFDGVIDEVRVWSYVRTQQQIQDAMALEITLETGLVGRWGFNEGSGYLADDSSGTGNQGIVSGATWVNGYPFRPPDSCGLLFDGTNDSVSFGGPLLPELGLETFTLECWLFRKGTGLTAHSGVDGVYAVPLVSRGLGETDGDTRDCNYLFGIDESGVLAADFEDMASGYNHPVLGSSTIENDTWIHAAVTYDGSTWSLYRDGELENEVTTGATPRYDSIQYFSIATATRSTGETFGAFDGILDEVRVWDHARTQEEIRSTLYTEVLSGTGLAGRWGFDECSGPHVHDSSAFDNTGTLVGASWVQGYNGPPEVTLVSPADGAGGLGLDVDLEVTVADPEGSDMTVTFYGREVVDPGHHDDFMIVALPDTQYYSQDGTEHFSDQTQWSVDNRDLENIVFVTHLGDIVDDRDTYESQWIVANTAMSILDGQVPYGMAPGNHDIYPDGTAYYYDYYFPYTRYEAEPWFGGRYEPSNYKSNYQLLTVSGIDLLFLHLEADYPDYVIAWADGVLSAYPDRLCILSTHIYMHGSTSERTTSAYFRPDGNSAEVLWNDLIRLHPNVKMVLCGHSCEAARRTDLNLMGEPVHQVLSDYQCRHDGGQGWMRLMRFSPDNGEIYVQTYSPTEDQYETGDDHEFTLSMDIAPSAPFEMLSVETGVASGAGATYTWSGLNPQSTYEWYVVAEDESTETRSPVRSFSTCGDWDGDGYVDEACGGADCDDTDSAVNPGAAEICENGTDDDCDGLADMEDPDCYPDFTLELDSFYAWGHVRLDFTLATPEPATWSTYMILTSPTVQVIPLWEIPLWIVVPAIEFPVGIPLPSIGWVGIWSGLFTAEGAQAFVLDWVNTG